MEIPGIEPGDDTGQPDEAGCTWCERGSGMILLVGALGLAYIGLDLLTGGWLSRAFVGGVTRAADAIDVEGTDGELGAAGAVTDEPGT